LNSVQLVGTIDTYVIRQNVDGTFTARVDDGSAWARASPYVGNEVEAEACIVGEGRGTEYTVSPGVFMCSPCGDLHSLWTTGTQSIKYPNCVYNASGSTVGTGPAVLAT
jgi:hypothetical protein